MCVQKHSSYCNTEKFGEITFKISNPVPVEEPWPLVDVLDGVVGVSEPVGEDVVALNVSDLDGRLLNLGADGCQELVCADSGSHPVQAVAAVAFETAGGEALVRSVSLAAAPYGSFTVGQSLDRLINNLPVG